MIACSRYPCGMHSGGCHCADCINNGNRFMPLTPAPGQVAGPYTPQSIGCICPPTSEQTCESPACPRQNPFNRKPGARI